MSKFLNGSCVALASAIWTATEADKYPTERLCCNFGLGIDAELVAGLECPFVRVDRYLRLVLPVAVLVRICVSE